MAGNSFGTLFRVTTFGESHCRAVGAIIEGVPAGLALAEGDLQPQLTRRRPGQSRLTTPRGEADTVTILSGTEAGRALGTPIALIIPNDNVRPGDYAEMLSVPRPGHADYTYQVKFGIRASSGGGRSSARETAARVAAGAVAEKWLGERFGTRIVSFVMTVGDVELPVAARRHASGRPWTREEVDTRGCLTLLRDPASGWVRLAPGSTPAQNALDNADEAAFVARYRTHAGASGVLYAPVVEPLPPAYVDVDDNVYDMFGKPVRCSAEELALRRSEELVHLRCPDPPTAAHMATLIRAVKADDDSIGGTLYTIITRVPIGLGEPVFDKLEAKLAHAMLSLPATKAFEIGSGFAGTRMRGSQHNDLFEAADADAATVGVASAAGYGRFAASGAALPDASLALLRTRTNHAGGTLGGISHGADLEFRVAIKPVSTVGLAQATATYGGEAAVLEAKGRHDPCVLSRAPPLVEAMAAIVLADAALLQSTRGTEHGSLAVLQPPAASSDDTAERKRPRMSSAM